MSSTHVARFGIRSEISMLLLPCLANLRVLGRMTSPPVVNWLLGRPVDSGSGLPAHLARSGFGSKMSIWLGPPTMNMKMTRLAFGSKCGSLAASGLPGEPGGVSPRASRASNQFRAMPPSPPPARNRKSRRDVARGMCVLMVPGYSAGQSRARTRPAVGIPGQQLFAQAGGHHVVAGARGPLARGPAVSRVRAGLLPEGAGDADAGVHGARRALRHGPGHDRVHGRGEGAGSGGRGAGALGPDDAPGPGARYARGGEHRPLRHLPDAPAGAGRRAYRAVLLPGLGVPVALRRGVHHEREDRVIWTAWLPRSSSPLPCPRPRRLPTCSRPAPGCGPRTTEPARASSSTPRRSCSSPAGTSSPTT